MPTFSFTDLTFPGSIGAFVTISDAGLIAGTAVPVGYGRPFPVYQGFFYANGTYTNVSFPGAVGSATSISPTGQLFGLVEQTAGVYPTAFVGNPGALTTFTIPGAKDGYTAIRDANSSLQAVGQYADALGTHGFLYQGGVVTAINAPGATSTIANDITESGRIAGTYTDASGHQHGFRLTSGAFTTIDFSGATSTTIDGASSTGRVFGTYTDASNASHAYAEMASGLTAVSVPGADNTTINGISTSGVVYGSYSDTMRSLSHGFVLVDGTYTTVDHPDPFDTRVTGISASGQIVGVDITSANSSAYFPRAFTATAMPDHLTTVYRFYDTATSDHFYTTDAAERDQILATLPSYKYEGAPWTTPDKEAGTADVYRFLDTATGSHFFTADAAERDSIVRNLPSYHYEGVAFEAYTSQTAAGAGAGAGALPLERFYNTQTGLHHFSASADETAYIRAGSAGTGWVDEGVGLIAHTPTPDPFHL